MQFDESGSNPSVDSRNVAVREWLSDGETASALLAVPLN